MDIEQGEAEGVARKSEVTWQTEITEQNRLKPSSRWSGHRRKLGGGGGGVYGTTQQSWGAHFTFLNCPCTPPLHSCQNSDSLGQSSS